MGIFDFFKKNKKVVREETTEEPKTPIKEKNLEEDGVIDFNNLICNNKYELGDEEFDKNEDVYTLKGEPYNGKAKEWLEWKNEFNYFNFKGGKISGVIHTPYKYYDGKYYRHKEITYLNGLKVLEREYIIGGGILNQETTYSGGEVIKIDDYSNTWPSGNVEIGQETIERTRKYENGKKVSDIEYDRKGKIINENNDIVEEEEPFWEVTETYVTLYKDGKEVAEGIAWDIYVNNWIEEVDDFQRESDHGEIILVDDKEFEDYDDIEWGEEKEYEGNIESYEDALEILNSVTGQNE